MRSVPATGSTIAGQGARKRPGRHERIEVPRAHAYIARGLFGMSPWPILTRTTPTYATAIDTNRRLYRHTVSPAVLLGIAIPAMNMDSARSR